MRADAEALRNLRYRVTPLRDLHHRVTFELIAEIGLPHPRLVSSKLGLKASRNLGAIHNLDRFREKRQLGNVGYCRLPSRERPFWNPPIWSCPATDQGRQTWSLTKVSEWPNLGSGEGCSNVHVWVQPDVG